MARDVEVGLQALIDSGHCEWHSAVDIILTDGIPIYLSTGQIVIVRAILGINQEIEYESKLEDPDSLVMSLTTQVNEYNFKVENVDTIIGQSLTGVTRQLDGARGMAGIIFIDEYSDAIYYDAKMPGELISGDVTEKNVSFRLISDVDVVVIGGRTIASEFPLTQPVYTGPISNPNDLGDRGGGIDDPDLRRLFGGRGRYPIFDPVDYGVN